MYLANNKTMTQEIEYITGASVTIDVRYSKPYKKLMALITVMRDIRMEGIFITVGGSLMLPYSKLICDTTKVTTECLQFYTDDYRSKLEGFLNGKT